MHSTNPAFSASTRALGTSRSIPATATAYWALRAGAALCFIGHGAFGFITKAAWLPYFAVAGIPEWLAWKLMPVVGAVDVTVGMMVLFAPRGLPLVYMSAWALWTALLRPLAGESAFEAIERAGNYGVPLALLMFTAMPRSLRELFPLRDAPVDDGHVVANVVTVLKWTTVLLLFGHGALGAITGKAVLTSHYAAIGLPASATSLVGWFEMGLAIVVAVRPSVALLLGIAVWKLATESLWIASGAPVWEIVERSGSVVAPLAMAALMNRKRA